MHSLISADQCSMNIRRQRLLGGISAIYWALMILLFPLTWLLPMILAALIHEFGHYLAIRCFGKRIRGVKVGISGALLETRDLSPAQEFICALAGPLAGLLPLLTIRIFPGVALCGLLQSLFNLLPVYPLDGGRMACCFFELLHLPQTFNRILSGVVLGTLVILSMYGAIVFRLVITPIVVTAILIYKAAKGKRPCKAVILSI